MSHNIILLKVIMAIYQTFILHNATPNFLACQVLGLEPGEVEWLQAGRQGETLHSLRGGKGELLDLRSACH